MAVTPDDFFRQPWNWREVPRDVASRLCNVARVVVVSQTNGPTSMVQWFRPLETYFSGWLPFQREHLRYYVWKQRPTELADMGGEVLAEGDQSPEYQDTPAPRHTEREPEDEDATLSHNADLIAIADVLRRAAAAGVPFCEECARGGN